MLSKCGGSSAEDLLGSLGYPYWDEIKGGQGPEEGLEVNVEARHMWDGEDGCAVG